ncbi:serine hydrolase domain-containing protein [Capnocytophaga canimorsus]|uniref:serine hydrolase domain-containing protein n=1 Tax=Capnocytophaga canimorsus TaxID=28188 RepID=UPI0015628199|nr:serine hydrolase domain-containing protein [Capnocytophaga canimorsus]
MPHLKSIIEFSILCCFFQISFSQNLPENSLLQKELTAIKSFKEAKEEAEKIIKFLIEDGQVPGASITITKGNHTLWQQGYGWANIQQKTPINPSKTLFRVASVSKPISATALAQLQDKKLMDWKASVYKYLPDFPKKKFDFSIEQLGGHLSGIRGYRGKEMFSNKAFSIEEGIDMFKNDPLIAIPGSEYNYNTFNWNLISLAVQKHLKKPFENIVFEEVLQPLSMYNTLADRGKITENQSIPYSKNKRGFTIAPAVNNFYKLAGGGFLSTSEDIARLGNALLDKNFLSENTKTQMLTSQYTTDKQKTGYGIGWQTGNDWKGRPYFGHIGNGIGGYAWFYVYPDPQVVIVMLFNVTNPKIEIYTKRFIDLILRGIEAENIKISENTIKKLKVNQN